VGFGKLIGRPSRAAMPVTVPAIGLVAALAVVGCGGGASISQTSEAAEVFARNCSACHSLIGNESRHRQGGDLVGYRLSRQQLLEFTREMPTRRPLTSAQLQLVVDYVLGFQQRGRVR
jgi:mono/diheme cytochrome c family protein